MTKVVAPSRIQLENVCVVIPVLVDVELLQNLLLDLNSGTFSQIVVSCADDSDFEPENSYTVTFIRSSPGRGIQIADAISSSDAEWIWVIHADVRVSRPAIQALHDALHESAWGAFRVTLDGGSKFLHWISFMMNWRSRLTSIYTGDQAMFFRRSLLDRVGGYPRIKLMEDIECSRRLRRTRRGSQVPVPLTVSARKWDREGVIRTILRMWWCRLLYFFGASPDNLATRYYRQHNAPGT